MTDERAYLDQGRRRSPADRLRMEFGVSLGQAARMLSAAGRDWDLACRYAQGEPYTVRGLLLTPELATELLNNYTAVSRPLDPRGVQRWVAVLSSAQDDPEFTGVHDEVRVARNGDTIAGQHLLHAVVQTGISVSVDIGYNADRAWGPPV